MNRILPNFLIVGAPKCGTTSLHNYLDQHPDIFMSKVKEPKYFSSQILSFPFKGKNDNLVESQLCKTLKEYEAVFSTYKNEKLIGESSADNLYYSEKVIPLIKSLLGSETKIIILLRNPVERAFSAYMHLKRDLREDKNTFNEALQVENKRIAKNYEFIWHYKRAGMYAKDVKHYLENFDSVKVILSENLKENPAIILKETCEFLEINDEFEFSTLEKFNSSGEIKNQVFQRIVSSNTPFKREIGKLIPKKIKEGIKSKNLKKNAIPSADKKMLSLHFKEDIQQLENILHKDLSNWLK